MKCLLIATLHEAIEILKMNDILKTHPGNRKCQMGWNDMNVTRASSNCPLRETWAWNVPGLDRGLAGESQPEACPPLHPLSSPTARGLACEQALRPVCVSVLPLNLHLRTSMCRRTTRRDCDTQRLSARPGCGLRTFISKKLPDLTGAA